MKEIIDGVKIYQDEEIFNLDCAGFRLIQNSKGYTFTTDAIILANTAKSHWNETVVDLGTGSGVISILMAAKTNAKKIYGIEIQERLAEMSSRSVELNQLNDKIEILNIDMVDAPSVLGKETIDVVVSNPPYMHQNKNVETITEIDICKKEIKTNVPIVCKVASQLLKFGGRFYCIVKAERMTDLMVAMRENNIEPKVLTPIQTTEAKDIDSIIIEGRKNGRSGIKILKPLVIMSNDGGYTQKVHQMYFSHSKKVGV